MSNTLTPMIPTLIATEAIELLTSRSGFLGRVRVETTQQAELKGGDTVVIQKQVGSFTPTNVSYASAASAQGITVPSVNLTFANHKEVKISANELESRIAQGNLTRILDLTVPGMIDGLVTLVDASLGALYTSATNNIGTAGAPITDDLVREGVSLLADEKVPLDVPGAVNLVVSPQGYFRDLMAIDRYVLANQSGNTEAMRGGKIPSQYNIGVDYTHNYTDATGKHGLLWHRDAMTIGFIEFEAANKYGGAAVEEAIVTDPATGLSLRVQKYYDATLRTWFYQMDVKWGVAVTDADRMVDVIH